MLCTMHWFLSSEKKRNVALTFGSPLRSIRAKSFNNEKKQCWYFFFLFAMFVNERFAIGFHFLAFGCGYFVHFSSLWWSDPRRFLLCISLLITHIPNDVNIAGLFFREPFPSVFFWFISDIISLLRYSSFFTQEQY